MEGENQFFEKRRMSLKQRERVVTSAMNALLANPNITKCLPGRITMKDVAEAAVQMARVMDDEWDRL